jgi:hypothetical protein
MPDGESTDSSSTTEPRHPNSTGFWRRNELDAARMMPPRIWPPSDPEAQARQQAFDVKLRDLISREAAVAVRYARIRIMTETPNAAASALRRRLTVGVNEFTMVYATPTGNALLKSETFTDARTAGTTFFNTARGSQPFIVMSRESGQRVLAAQTARAGRYANGEQRFCKTLSNSPDLPDVFRKGYYEALAASVEQRMKQVDWEQAKPKHSSEAPILDHKLYDDLNLLAYAEPHRAMKVWADHAPPGTSAPAFVDPVFQQQKAALRAVTVEIEAAYSKSQGEPGYETPGPPATWSQEEAMRQAKLDVIDLRLDRIEATRHYAIDAMSKNARANLHYAVALEKESPEDMALVRMHRARASLHDTGEELSSHEVAVLWQARQTLEAKEVSAEFRTAVIERLKGLLLQRDVTYSRQVHNATGTPSNSQEIGVTRHQGDTETRFGVTARLHHGTMNDAGVSRQESNAALEIKAPGDER